MLLEHCCFYFFESQAELMVRFSIIFTDTANLISQLSFSDIKNLNQLENDLNQTIFIDNQLKITLCDNSFNEIMSLD